MSQPKSTRPVDGQLYWEQLQSGPDAVTAKSRALATAHKLGYSPRIWTWSPAQVEAVLERLAEAPPAWGGPGKPAGRRDGPK